MYNFEEVKTEASPDVDCLALNHVDYLLKNSFAKMTYEDQHKIRKLGAHQSEEFTLTTQDGRGVFRKFEHDWFHKMPWLSFSKEKNSLFCFYCLLFGGDDFWTKTGTRDLKKLPEKIDAHNSSKTHIQNTIAYKRFGRSSTQSEIIDIKRQTVQQHNELVEKHRHVLSRIVDCLKFCGAHALPVQGLAGTDSFNQGIFLDLVSHSTKLDSVLNDHLKEAIVAKDKSEATQNELLECCRQVYLEQIRNEVKGVEFVSIQVEEILGLSCQSQFAIVLRYLMDAKPVERFVTLFDVVDRTAECFTKMLIDELKPFELNDKLVAQAYDGATSAMMSAHGRVEEWMKEQFPYAKYMHCYAQQMDAVVQNVCSSLKRMRIFFASISGFGSFLTSSRRSKMLPNCDLNLESCNSYGKIVKFIAENKAELLECFERIQNELEWDDRTICDSLGLRRMLHDDEFLFLVSFFNAVFQHTELLYTAIQARFSDGIIVTLVLQRFISAMNEIRNNLRSVAGDGQLWVKIKDEHGSTSVQTDAQIACDNIVSEMKNRFQSLDLICSTMTVVDPKHYNFYYRKFPWQKVLTISDNYPMLNREKLGNELSVIYADSTLFNLNKYSDLMQFLFEMDLGKTFSEVYKLLEIVLVTPVSTAVIVQCFDTLSQIRSFTSDTVERDKLNALVILAVHKEFILEILNFNGKVIEKFASQEHRKEEYMNSQH